MKKLIGILILFIALSGYSQNNSYQIKIELDGFSDSVYYLVSYYADKFQAVDTCISKTGVIEFGGDSFLQGGIYVLAGEKMNKYFEFLIDKDQEFEISVSRNNIIETLKVIGSEENEHFFKYLRFNKTEYEKIKAEQEKLTKSSDITETNRIKNNINNINTKITDFKTDFILNNPKTLLSAIFKGMQEPKVDPNLPMQQSYQFYKKNYWKNIDLTDGRMIRTPILHGKITGYFDKLINQHPDSLISEIDMLLNQRMDESIKNHIIWNLTLKYEYPDIMGLDKVFVHLVQNYFLTKKITGISQNIIKNLEKRALKIDRVLIGNRAPDLIMMDTLNQAQSMYGIDAKYTLIIF